ncbi:MAG: hypothetical protein KDA80_08115 [Planctomycetaceae bacterium]|nr:hypothetical protein [Planctomycetaceae bacterium]
MSDDRKCSDCDGELREVRMIDTGHGDVHHPMKYAAADAKQRWTGYYPVEGIVKGFMCQECGLIRIYGIPTE